MTDDDRYIVVIRGVLPGVYVGLSNAEEAIGDHGKRAFYKRATRATANQLFVDRSMAGEVRWLSPIDGRVQPK
jgi:hypothetical protein